MATVSRDIKTQGVVLKRTNYGEADRILNIITPLGKFGVMARGVRKPKSKLAGGVEMLVLADLQIHQGKSELLVLTGARMVKYYSEIVKDYERMQLLGMVLKRVSIAAEAVENEEFFDITVQVMEGLNDGMDTMLVRAWFILNLLRVSGEQVNCYRDNDGDELKADERYDWSTSDETFFKKENGNYGENEIKLVRLLLRMKLKVFKKVIIEQDVIVKVCDIIKTWEN